MNLKPSALAVEKKFRLFSYMLVFLMVTCVVMTLSILIRNAVPGWHAGLIAGILLFIAVDRLYTYQGLQSITALSSEWFIAYGAQWIVILLFSRLLLSYANGPEVVVRDLTLLVRGTLIDLITIEFFATLLLEVAVWILTAQFLELLDEIGLDMKFALSEEANQFRSDTVPAHGRLVNLIFGVGIGLVILAALTRLNWEPIISNTTGLPPVHITRFSGGETGALLYFVFGLALLSLSRLMSLQTNWNRLRIPVSSNNLVRQWLTYSLLFLLILMVVVSILPAGDSLGFFSVLATLLSFLITVIVFLAQLVVALVLLLFSLPFMLFGKTPPLLGGSAPPALPTMPPVQDTSPFLGGPLWELIRSILLWGGLTALIIFALIQFVRQHDSVLTAMRRSRLTNWLVLAWQWLYRSAGRTGGILAQTIADGWQNILSRLEGKRVLPRPAFLNLRSLDPRRRVYFFYLAMIRRGADQGLKREPSQTPAEYATQLEKALPSSTEDIDLITDAFMQARYSHREVKPDDANVVKATWGRIRRALQATSRNKQ
jgi:hypothetical protein